LPCIWSIVYNLPSAVKREDPTPVKEAVTADAAPSPKGPYSPAIVTSGRTLYVSGQGPVDPATGEFLNADFDAEARQTLRNVAAVVEAAGGTLAQAVKVNVYLSDMGNFARLNEIYTEFFPEPRPARTTVQSNLPGMSIEVDTVVALDA
jgi:2-iminobutanoate/2-iminopropanoate deaminase